MCGRFNLRSNQRQLAEFFGIPEPADLPPRWNIAPTQQILSIVAGTSGAREPRFFRWGLISPGGKVGKGPPLINARAETVRDKPTFRDAFRNRRCLIPADGFYEWRKLDKQPFHITMADGRPFAFAGLWDRIPLSGEPAPVEACTIVTTSANERVQAIHDRMPVIVPRDAYQTWLTAPFDEAARLLQPYPSDLMTARPVSPIVNNYRNDVPDCIRPIDT